MGEDPYLAGRLAAAEVRAIQDRHVISMVKHFIGNNAETGRTGYATSGGRTPAINTVVGERALQELYYPPSRRWSSRAAPGRSWAPTTGSTESTPASTRHPAPLKQRLGLGRLRGPRLPACRARPGRRRQRRARPARAGRDRGTDRRGLHLRPHPGRAPGRDRPADPVRDLRRRARPSTRSPTRTSGRPWPARPEHVALATRIATDGMVLLANRDGLLPLDAEQVRSVAVIGTARDDAQWVMAGSPCVRVSPDRRVTPLEGITARAGAGVRVAFAQGSFGDAALAGGADRGPQASRARGDGPAGGVLERRDARRRAGADGRRPDGGHPPGPGGTDRHGLVGPVDGHDHPHGGRARTGSPSWPPGSSGSRSTGPWSPPGSGSSARCSTARSSR